MIIDSADSELTAVSESTQDSPYVSLRLRIEAELSGDPEHLSPLAPSLAAALVSLLYHDLRELKDQ